ncbi:MAG: ComF family protein [Pirellulales bacterium]|jgi:ComF family protein
METLARYAAAAADLLFPPECLLCQRPLLLSGDDREKAALGRDFCAACLAELTSGLSRCAVCGAAGGLQLGASCCEACGRCPPPWRGAFIFATYGDRVRDAVLRSKQPSGEAVACSLGRRLGQLVRTQVSPAALMDLVVPVPMHWRRRAVRGTSSAQVIAGAVADALRRPMRSRLRRIRATNMQNTLPPAERPANVSGAFRASRRVRGQSVLLVDDVITTGATVAACTQALLAAGACEVYVAAVAKAERSDLVADDGP